MCLSPVLISNPNYMNGGLGGIIAEECEAIDVYDSLLTLKGLRIIHKRCTGK